MRTLLLTLAATTAMAAPATAQQGPASSAQTNAEPSVTVQMKDGKGQPVGTIEVRQTAHGTVFIANLQNLPPGAHGFHIHERGRCEGPNFQSAGEHLNPTKSQHGYESPQGFHAGDLPNIHVAKDGTATAEFHSNQVTLRGETGAVTGSNQPQAAAGNPVPLMSSNGTAIVVHARADDYRSSDSAGGRIACGVISEAK